MNITYANIESVVSEYLKLAPQLGEINRTMLTSVANDGIEKISTGSIMDLRIAVLPVENFHANLPKGYKAVEQILYRKEPKGHCTREEIIEWTQGCFGSGCKLKIIKECPKCHMSGPCDCAIAAVVVTADGNWIDAHPGLQYEGTRHYNGEFSTATKKCPQSISEFQILRYSTNNFHLMKSQTNDDCRLPSTSNRDEYMIQGGRIETSFKKGEILLSYRSEPVDENGYLMIPDHPIAYRAVTSYMLERMALQEYTKNKTQGDRAFWGDMSQQAERDVKIARTQLEFPSPDEFEAFIKNHWNKLIPNYHSEINLNRYKTDEYQPYTV